MCGVWRVSVCVAFPSSELLALAAAAPALDRLEAAVAALDAAAHAHHARLASLVDAQCDVVDEASGRLVQLAVQLAAAESAAASVGQPQNS